MRAAEWSLQVCLSAAPGFDADRGFFEWKDIYSTGKDKQPYAIAMKSGEPFALAAIWEMWQDAKTEEKSAPSACSAASRTK